MQHTKTTTDAMLPFVGTANQSLLRYSAARLMVPRFCQPKLKRISGLWVIEPLSGLTIDPSLPSHDDGESTLMVSWTLIVMVLHGVQHLHWVGPHYGVNHLDGLAPHHFNPKNGLRSLEVERLKWVFEPLSEYFHAIKHHLGRDQPKFEQIGGLND